MNNKEFKQINENWDKFLNEEGEQIDEAIISASAALGFIYLFLKPYKLTIVDAFIG